VAEGQILEGQLGTRPEEGPHEDEKGVEQEHRWLPEGALQRWAAENLEVCVSPVTISNLLLGRRLFWSLQASSLGGLNWIDAETWAVIRGTADYTELNL